jgi:hypothetical protein
MKRITATLAIILLAPLAHAQDDEYDFDLFGQWRYIVSHSGDFPLNDLGDQSGLNLYVDQRLQVGTVQPVTKHLEFIGELEIFYGQVYGDHDNVGSFLREDERTTLRGWDLKEAELRQLWIRWDLPWGQLRAGQMKSNWGLGMLANGGDLKPGRFGFPDQGDLSDRLVFATRPFAWEGGWLSKVVAAVGGGVVYHDENCDLRDGDIGGEVIASMFYRDEGINTGLYIAGRIQSDSEDTFLNVAAFDLLFSVDAGPGHQGLVAATELALLAGKTDRLIHADHLDGVDVLAFGAIARAGWRFGFMELMPIVEFGFASGDADPHDDIVTSFSFDPDYKVGLVLFDTVLRGVSAMAAAEAADPERIGQPLPGTNMLPTKGRVNGAMYINPTIQIQPLEQLTVMAGFLYAWSAVPFAQSYQTFKNGGVNTNLYGLQGPSRDLGYEVDVGFDWDQEIFGDLRVVAGVQAGWFFPGSAFDCPSGTPACAGGTRPDTIMRVLGRAMIAW